MAGKLQVGHCLASYRMRWTAYLWLVAGKPGEGFAGEVPCSDLRDLRDTVAARLGRRGPWWT
jgi:hypothetical protein